MGKLNGVRVAILVANGFEQSEMEKPRQALEKEGAKTILISPEKKQVDGWHHDKRGDSFPVDVSLSDARADDYEALLLPGGVFNPDQLRMIPQAINFIKTIHEQDKPIAAICHGPWLLIDSKVAEGKKITSWPSIKADLLNAGAHWLDEPVVIDEGLVTSRKPDDIPEFNKAMVELFQQTTLV